jgi:antitoxin component YwqK of YwqJK toxin-antitoxin module
MRCSKKLSKISVSFSIAYSLGAPALAQTFRNVHTLGKNTSRVTVVRGDSIEEINLLPLQDSRNVSPSQGGKYYWYSDNQLLSTHGGFDGRLLDGAYSLQNRTGSLLAKGSYDRGLKSGAWTTWYPGGTIQKVEHWQKGVLQNGFEEFYPNGAIKRRGTYSDGDLDGKVYRYDEQGKEEVMRYRSGAAKPAKVKAQPSARFKNLQRRFLEGSRGLYQKAKTKLKRKETATAPSRRKQKLRNNVGQKK